MNDLTEQLLDHRARSALLLQSYDAAPAAQRRRVALAEFYCPAKRSCRLLTVWQSPHGRLARLPQYKLSVAVNEAESTAGGRRANTSDGDRHWNGAVVFVDDLTPEVGLPLNCDHHRSVLRVPELLAAIAGVVPGRPIRSVVASLRPTAG